MRVEPLAIEVGLGLVGLVEGAQDSALLRRISSIRKQLATELGYLLPPVRVTDNLQLRSREYVISLKGVEIARYELPQGCELAISTGPGQMQARRPGHTRAGLRHQRRLDPQRAMPNGRATRATRWSTRSACWARISRS